MPLVVFQRAGQVRAVSLVLAVAEGLLAFAHGFLGCLFSVHGPNIAIPLQGVNSLFAIAIATGIAYTLCMSAHDQFVEEINGFLERYGISPTMFGREVRNDPTFVSRMRKGRSPTLKSVDQIRENMKMWERKLKRRRKKK